MFGIYFLKNAAMRFDQMPFPCYKITKTAPSLNIKSLAFLYGFVWCCCFVCMVSALKYFVENTLFRYYVIISSLSGFVNPCSNKPKLWL